MQTILPSEFKRGMALVIDGVLQIIEDFHAAGTAQAKPKLHVRLRQLKSGRVVDRVFADNERVSLAELEHRRVQFSYLQGDTYVFLDSQTYEEVDLTADQVGDRRWFLKENEDIRALFVDGKFLDIVLPAQVTLKVSETAPAQRGGSDAAWKPAKLQTGLEIMVPLFIDKGEAIRVDTHSRKYLGKETG
jgi:elongation factor P